MAVSRRRVYLRVAESWMNTIVCLITITGVMALSVLLASRFGGARFVIGILFSAAALSVVMFVLSEVVITTLFRATKPIPDRHPQFIGAVDKLWKRRWLRPRLYLVEMSHPNAFAFGMGFLGQCGIAITQSLYDMLEPEELEGVIAHEIGHIKSKDVGLMTVIQMITGGAEQLAAAILNGGTSLGKTPLALIIGSLLRFFSRFVIPMGRSAISQEREFAADAIGSLLTGSTKGLKRALEKLTAGLEEDSELPGRESVFSELFISHPRMEQRLAALDALES